MSWGHLPRARRMWLRALWETDGGGLVQVQCSPSQGLADGEGRDQEEKPTSADLAMMCILFLFFSDMPGRCQMITWFAGRGGVVTSGESRGRIVAISSPQLELSIQKLMILTFAWLRHGDR